MILMTSGRYGRMRIGRCVRVDFGFVGCYSDVIDVLDRHCSGRTECQLRIPDPEMDERRPCLSDLTRYLEASFRCIPGPRPRVFISLFISLHQILTNTMLVNTEFNNCIRYNKNDTRLYMPTHISI